MLFIFLGLTPKLTRGEAFACSALVGRAALQRRGVSGAEKVGIELQDHNALPRMCSQTLPCLDVRSNADTLERSGVARSRNKLG